MDKVDDVILSDGSRLRSVCIRYGITPAVMDALAAAAVDPLLTAAVTRRTVINLTVLPEAAALEAVAMFSSSKSGQGPKITLKFAAQQAARAHRSGVASGDALPLLSSGKSACKLHECSFACRLKHWL